MEVEAKGVFWAAAVKVGRDTVAVTFYDPVRLSQDVADELSGHPSVELRRVLVVSSVTEDHMRIAVDRAPLAFFE